MSRKELFKSLNSLCKEMDYLYEINSGGCCYVAACIAEQLEKFNIPFKVVHYNLWSCHYAIKVSDRYINRSGFTKKEISSIFECTSKYMFNKYHEQNWNPTYSVKHNDIVYEKIKQLFDENSRTRF